MRSLVFSRVLPSPLGTRRLSTSRQGRKTMENETSAVSMAEPGTGHTQVRGAVAVAGVTIASATADNTMSLRSPFVVQLENARAAQVSSAIAAGCEMRMIR